jgi:hypothetical protein
MPSRAATRVSRGTAPTVVTGMQDRPSLGDIISTAGLAVGLITAWLYVAGWSYAYRYFFQFDIPFLMLDIPFEQLLVYGGLVVQKNMWISIICSALLIAGLWALARWASLLGRFVVTATIVVLVIVAFGLARVAGHGAAMNDFTELQATGYRQFPRVELRWEGAGPPSDTLISDILKTDCGRLLFASKERLFLIRPVQTASDLPLDTFVIAGKKIDAMRLRNNYPNCP